MRGLRNFPGVSKRTPILKLFAKHIKQAEQEQMLKDRPYALAVGNPNRITRLIEAGALSLERTELLVLDTSFKDKKGFTLLNVHGTTDDLCELYQDHCRAQVEDGRLRVAFF